MAEWNCFSDVSSALGQAIPQGPPLSHSERGKANTPSSPPLHVTAMTDRRILRDCCPLPAEPRIRQIVSTDLPCYSAVYTKDQRQKVPGKVTKS
ncbi:UNVERIFIED_CONTAM: hypothetical protein FKN15_047451 [Acipenser sinensis]